MYTIKCANFVLHDPRLEAQKIVVNEPKLSLELNKHGTISFQILPNHPYYTEIRKLKSFLSVYQDSDWLWSGRVLNNNPDIYLTQKCNGEGETAFLCDSIQPFAEFHNISVENFFRTLINNHNLQVEQAKQFTVGIINVVDNNDSLYRFTSYENTWEAIENKLINRLGGFIRTRHVNSVNYIDYIADYDNYNEQTVEFGKNMISFEQSGKAEEIITVIVPLGAKLENENSDSSTEAEERLTISSVNNGSIFIEDAAAIAEYGRIVGTVFFDDVTVPQNLKTKGAAELALRKLFTRGITVTALDLHHQNINIEQIKLGDMIRCIFPALSLDIWLQVTKMDIDLADVSKTVITLGKTVSSMTDNTSSNQVKANIQKVVESYGYGKQIADNSQSLTQFKQNVNSAGYITAADVGTIRQLPQVTEADNNKILMVVNGQWSAVELNNGTDPGEPESN